MHQLLSVKKKLRFACVGKMQIFIRSNIRNTYRTTSVPDHLTIACSSTEIWPFEISVISTFREVWTQRDSFLKRKFENWAPTGSRLGPVLSWSTISFELHAKMAEERDLEKCNFGKFKSPMTLTLTLDWVKVISACTIHVGLPTCPTTWLASRSTEIWPFEFHEISTFRKVWSHVIAFLEGNSKIRLRQGVGQVPCCHYQPLVLSSMAKWRRR